MNIIMVEYGAELFGAISSCIATWVPYILFIAIAERCVNIIRNAFSGKEHYF